MNDKEARALLRTEAIRALDEAHAKVKRYVETASSKEAIRLTGTLPYLAEARFSFERASQPGGDS